MRKQEVGLVLAALERANDKPADLGVDEEEKEIRKINSKSWRRRSWRRKKVQIDENESERGGLMD